LFQVDTETDGQTDNRKVANNPFPNSLLDYN